MSNSPGSAQRGAQSPPPERQSDSQIGSSATGNINGGQSTSPTEHQHPSAKGATTLKAAREAGVAQGPASNLNEENRGTEGLESNPKGVLHDWSENIGKRPQEWKAPGGDVDA